MRMKRQLAYRTAAYAGIVTQVVFGLVLVAIFAAFYANGIKAPMTLPQVMTYVWLGQAFFAMTPYSVFPDAELREQIRDGSVATELLRPVDLHSLWMARTLASKLAPTALRCLPVIVVATLFAGMHLPPDIPSFLAWLLTTIGALVLISAFIVLPRLPADSSFHSRCSRRTSAWCLSGFHFPGWWISPTHSGLGRARSATYHLCLGISFCGQRLSSWPDGCCSGGDFVA
jgi:hypothetical protein